MRAVVCVALLAFVSLVHAHTCPGFVDPSFPGSQVPDATKCNMCMMASLKNAKTGDGCKWCWNSYQKGCLRNDDTCVETQAVEGPTLPPAMVAAMKKCKEGPPKEAVVVKVNYVAIVGRALRTCNKEAMFAADNAMQALQMEHQNKIHSDAKNEGRTASAHDLKGASTLTNSVHKAIIDDIKANGATCFGQDANLALKIVRQTAGNFAKRMVMGTPHSDFLTEFVREGHAAFGAGSIDLTCTATEDQCGRIAYLDRTTHILYLCADHDEIRMNGGKTKCGTGYVNANNDDGFVSYKDTPSL